jgi:hypothetical protein
LTRQLLKVILAKNLPWSVFVAVFPARRAIPPNATVHGVCEEGHVLRMR